MKVYLIAGANCETLKQILQKGSRISIVKSDRNIEETYYYLKDNRTEFDIILLVDQGVNCSISSFGRFLSDFMDLMDAFYQDSVFKFITKEPQYETVFKQVTDTDERFSLYFVDKIKVPISLIKEICAYKKQPAEKQKRDNENNWWSFFKKIGQDERKSGARQDIKAIKDEPRGEITQQIREETTQEIRPEITQQIREEITQEIRPEITQQIREEITQEIRQEINLKEREKIKEKPKEEREWRFFKRENKTTHDEPKKYVSSDFVRPSSNKVSFVSGNINRIALVTGHRGSGVTGTAANLGVEASAQGLRTIILDMDLEYKAMNLYFSKFGDEVNVNPDLANALIKCLLKPDSFETNSCRINSNLWVSTLAYSVESNDKMMEMINITRILALATVLKSKFNLVIVDIPMHILRRFSELLLHVDSVGLCVNNSLYSVINTVSSMGEFDKSFLTLLAIKSRIIITKYNPCNVYCKDPLTPEATCEIFNNLNEALNETLNCAGTVPYCNEYDLQIDSGKKICNTSDEFRSYYVEILNNLFR